VLLAYFGEAFEGPCGNCDTCLEPVATFDGTVVAQKALSAAARTGQRFGAGHLIDVLMGKGTPRVVRLGHDRLPTFGVGRDISERQWRAVLRQLVAAGFLGTDADGHGSLKLTARSASLLKGEATLTLRRDPGPAPRSRSSRAGSSRAGSSRARVSADLGGVELALFEALRELRRRLAQEQGVPPYVIFHDATLREMAERKPRSRAELAVVSGVGASKLERYGEVFLAVLADARTAGDGTDGHGDAWAGAGDAGGGRARGAPLFAGAPDMSTADVAAADLSTGHPGAADADGVGQDGVGLDGVGLDGVGLDGADVDAADLDAADRDTADRDTADLKTADLNTADLDTGDLDTGDLDTVERTRELLLAGYGPEAVAGMRNLKLRTIEGHLAELVRRGDLTVEEATGLGPDDVREVELALEELPPEARRRLKPLFEALGGRYPYGQLRCVLEGLRQG
jgi:hypothetical protein